MSNLRFKLRQLIVSNKHLRIIRNDLKDHYRSTKYRIRLIKTKLTNPDIENSKKQEMIILTDEEIKEKYEEIKNKNLSLINLQSFDDKAPLVTIIIINRNGINHLKRLFKDFKETIEYPSYEIIVVYNASTDDSISFLKELNNNLPLKIIRNPNNKSFSEANNQAAETAEGEYLLLLNNDVEPTHGWLNQMMQSILKSEDTGAVGAKLIYPDCSKSHFNKNNSFKTQHEGIAFKAEPNEQIKPYNISNNKPFNEINKHLQLRAAVTASALLINKDKYLEVGGLDERYNYGYEDVDLCLNLIKKGYHNIYCHTALLYHYEFDTQEKDKNHKVKKRSLQNQRLFHRKWDPWLSKQLLKDKIYNNHLFSEYPLKIAFIVTESGENASAGDYFTASELGDQLKKFGWNITYVLKSGKYDWYDLDNDVDILISLLDVYDPRKIRCTNKSLIKIAWPRNWFERWFHNPGLSNYDIILTSSKTACKYIKEKTGIKTFLLPIATNTDRFNENIPENKEYSSDYCFTGSYWDDPRDIIEMLNPENIPYNFKLYGKNWENFDKFKKYYHGFINYPDLPTVYASTKIVIDDVNRGSKNFGSVNSRVYDALACGALILTNGVIGAEESFNGQLPVWRSQEELNNLISHYLSNEDKRIKKVKTLQELILKNHTYEKRADTLKKILEQEYDLK
jgi:GT2 family glycosyltransferase